MDNTHDEILSPGADGKSMLKIQREEYLSEDENI